MAKPTIHLVAASAYEADRRARRELHNAIITSERDYVSALATRIRDTWIHLGLPNYLHTQTLPQNHERLFGCDALILMRLDDNHAKVCLFEAKWPRIATPRTQWDSIQHTSGLPHFSDQLQRQARWTKQAAIWEHILNEYPPGYAFSRFDRWGATCVWHDVAYQFDCTYRDPSSPWCDADVLELLKNMPIRQRSLRSTIETVANCRRGERLPIHEGYVSIASTDAEHAFELPASYPTASQLGDTILADLGVETYLYLALNRETG